MKTPPNYGNTSLELENNVNACKSLKVTYDFFIDG